AGVVAVRDELHRGGADVEGCGGAVPGAVADRASVQAVEVAQPAGRAPRGRGGAGGAGGVLREAVGGGVTALDTGGDGVANGGPEPDQGATRPGRGGQAETAGLGRRRRAANGAAAAAGRHREVGRDHRPQERPQPRPTHRRRRTPRLALSVSCAYGGRWQQASLPDQQTRRAGMLSFIVPAYNEQLLIGRTLGALHAAAGALREPYEVIVADDASTDETAAIAHAHGAQVVSVNHRQIAATRNAGARRA